MTPHTSKTFEDELEDLRTRVMTVGGTVEAQIRQALRAYDGHDIDGAAAAQEIELTVRRERAQADRLCTEVIALRQPAAKDLRMLLGFMRIFSDLRRMSKQASKIARMVSREQNQRSPLPRIGGIFHAGEMALSMLQQALNAVSREDTQQAYEVIRSDEQLDEQYIANMRQLITYMMEDPRTISAALDVLWAAKSIERIGDYAENIAEVAVYIAEGEDLRCQPKNESHDE